ncbi:MAG: hypothetical protein AAF514_08515, partial [Verrucomicrobiota bacterium]
RRGKVFQIIFKKTKRNASRDGLAHVLSDTGTPARFLLCDQKRIMEEGEEVFQIVPFALIVGRGDVSLLPLFFRTRQVSYMKSID